MEAILRELTKLESKSCANEDIEALQAGIDALERWQAALNASSDDAPGGSRVIKVSRRPKVLKCYAQFLWTRTPSLKLLSTTSKLLSPN